MLDAKLFDHTILRADAMIKDVDKVCEEALEYGFESVCVNGYYTKYVSLYLEESDVKVCTVIGFPLGQMTKAAKVFEAKQAIHDCTDEVDMVINVAALKDGIYDYVESEIHAVKEVCGDCDLKVILETCLLTEEEIRIGCELAVNAGADYVKTSTGFSTGGATVEAVEFMRKCVGENVGVKASGGIRDTKTAEAMVKAGANRIGASACVDILLGK